MVIFHPSCNISFSHLVRLSDGVKANILAQSGTDSSEHLVGTRAGASVLHELWLYVNRCGFTPTEALASATSKIAERFKLKDRGMIQVGRRADLVLVKGNPTESIDSLYDIVGVWRNGERVVWA
jgi:imidazolonepropionase-like amidohydrolase